MCIYILMYPVFEGHLFSRILIFARAFDISRAEYGATQDLWKIYCRSSPCRFSMKMEAWKYIFTSRSIYSAKIRQFHYYILLTFFNTSKFMMKNP